MKNKRINSLSFCLLATTLALLSSNLSAHKGATGIVKQRMDAMSEMGDAMGVMADMVKGKRPLDAEAVQQSTHTLAQHAKQMLDLFPDTHESRNGKGTEALPIIWKDWERFASLTGRLEEEVGSLQAIAANNLDEQTLRAEFRNTARACSACHDDFRKPED